MDKDELIKHALKSLRETARQDTKVSAKNTSIAIVGVDQEFTILEDDALEPYFASMASADAPAPMQTS